MEPAFRITAGGADITAKVKDRLVTLRFRDEAEAKSDRLLLKLDDRPVDGVHVEFPVPGTELKLWLGYQSTGATYMGAFKVTDISYSSPPATMEIKALAADMPKPFRTAVDRSWHETTLGAIVSTVAGEHGYTPQIDGTLGAIEIPHVDQTAESPMAFVTRLASRHDAVAKPVNNFLVLAPKGEAKAAAGTPLPDFTLRPEQTSRWRYQRTGRTDPTAATQETPAQDGGVRTDTWDIDDAEPKFRIAGDPSVPERVRYWHADLPETKGVAATGKNTRDRNKATFRVELSGDPALMAEQRLILEGFRPGIPTTWRMLEVQHEVSEGGYTCSCRAELFQEGQESAS